MAYTAPVVNNSGLLGANFLETNVLSTSTPEYPGLPLTIGTIATTSTGGRYIYVTASAAINQYDFVGIVPAFTAAALTTAIATTATYIGVAQVAIASGASGWITLQGNATGNVIASTALNVALYPTSTAGYLDDAGSTVIFKIPGIVAVATRGTTNGSVAVVMTYPVYAEA